jgi:uncharacterized protein (UPF0548 family)
MFLLGRPSDARIREILASQREAEFSYAEVGATATSAPRGYVADHERSYLGPGGEAFARAKAAVRHWEMFQNGWTHLCWPDAPIAQGTTVGVLVRAFGLYSLNLCRIVYVIDENRRYGFAYGTLAEHAEAGEERFLVEQSDDGAVWFDLLAFSRPRHPAARIAYPLARALQRRFRRDAVKAMARAAR